MNPHVQYSFFRKHVDPYQKLDDDIYCFPLIEIMLIIGNLNPASGLEKIGEVKISWRTDDGPLIMVFGSFLPSSN